MLQEAIQFMRANDYEVDDNGKIHSDLPEGEEGMALNDTLEDKFNCQIIIDEIKEIEV